MNNKSILVVGLVAVIGLVLGALAYTKVPERVIGGTGPQGERGLQGPVGPQGPAGKDGRDGKDGNTILGAQSQQVTEGDCLFNQGSRICVSSKPMFNASTTCSFRSPNATSTFAGVATFTKTFDGSFDVQWGKATNAFSTTTSLGYKTAAIASGDLGSFVSSTSPAILASAANMEDPASLIAPNTWVNFKVGSSSPTLQGFCNGTFTY